MLDKLRGLPDLAKNKEGTYLVKTGYQLSCEKDIRYKTSASDVTDTRKFWTRVWKLRIPNKIKKNFKRACYEASPTLVNLQCRKILDVSICS